MALVAPYVRKHLSADALFHLVRCGFASLPDPRLDDTDIAFTDALMSAWALFSLPAPSLLAFDTERAEGNVATLYGMARVPCDTPRRAILAPVSPQVLRPVLQSVWRQLQRGKALEARLVLAGHSFRALDGTEYCSSRTMHWASGLHKVHRHGPCTYSHQRLGAVIVPPDPRAVMPLMPEPIVRYEGTAKNDGARHAAKRFVAKRRQEPPPLKCLITADRVRAHAPPIETRHAYGRHDILGVKAGDHASWFQEVEATEQTGRVTSYERHDRAAGLVQRWRLLHDVPLQASHTEVRGNVVAYGERGQDQVQHCSWVTDLRVNTRHGFHRRRGGRARWKMDHEPCHTLQNQGDHCAPHDGHGEQPLSVVLALLRRLAFWVDQAPQRCCALCQAVWAQLGSKRLRWERRRARLYDDAFASRRQLGAALWYGCQKASPRVTLDASSSSPLLLRRRAIEPGSLSSPETAMPSGRERSAFNMTACHIASRKSLQKPGKGLVEPLAELSTTQIASDSQVISGNCWQGYASSTFPLN
jgi:hypothetical protein